MNVPYSSLSQALQKCCSVALLGSLCSTHFLWPVGLSVHTLQLLYNASAGFHFPIRRNCPERKSLYDHLAPFMWCDVREQTFLLNKICETPTCNVRRNRTHGKENDCEIFWEQLIDSHENQSQLLNL